MPMVVVICTYPLCKLGYVCMPCKNKKMFALHSSNAFTIHCMHPMMENYVLALGLFFWLVRSSQPFEPFLKGQTGCRGSLWGPQIFCSLGCFYPISCPSLDSPLLPIPEYLTLPSCPPCLSSSMPFITHHLLMGSILRWVMF